MGIKMVQHVCIQTESYRETIIKEYFNSWIKFNDQDKIIELREYQSKVPNYFPYNTITERNLNNGY